MRAIVWTKEDAPLMSATARDQIAEVRLPSWPARPGDGIERKNERRPGSGTAQSGSHYALRPGNRTDIFFGLLDKVG